MRGTRERDRFMEVLASLGMWADRICDDRSPPEVVRIVMTLGFLTGIMLARSDAKLASSLVTGASEEIPDAVTMAQELAEELAEE